MPLDANVSCLVHRVVARKESSHASMTHGDDAGPQRAPAEPAEKTRAPATLDRAEVALWKAFCFCVTFIGLEVGKQVMSYSISYYNGGVYPMPQTAIVCATEAIKLLLMVVMATTNGVWREISPSAYFAVPSVVYAITNNLYFFALHYTTPPVWSVLIQSRVIITALVYRFWFKREVTNVQWVALVMLLVAIAMSQVSGKSSSPESMNLLLVAMALSLIQACLSVIASVYTEYLFKTDKRSFVEQQLQMYFFSTLIGLGFFFMQQYSATSNTTDMKDVSFGIKICLVVALLLASLGGITVATIVKKLDNIVKIYSAALANMFTAVLCSLLFPNKFSLNVPFACSLLLMFLAIFLYERKHVDLGACGGAAQRALARLRWVFEWKLLQVAMVSLLISSILAVAFVVVASRHGASPALASTTT